MASEEDTETHTPTPAENITESRYNPKAHYTKARNWISEHIYDAQEAESGNRARKGIIMMITVIIVILLVVLGIFFLKIKHIHGHTTIKFSRK